MEDFYFEDNAELPEAEFESKVPSDFRFAYTKGDNGVYKLNDQYAAAAKLIDGRGRTLKQTKATNQSVGLESKTRREALEKWAAETGFDTPEAAKEAIAALQEKINSKSAIKPEEVREAIKGEYEQKLTKAEEKNAAMFTTLEKHLRDKDALAALAEHKGNAKLLMPVILAQTKVVQDEETGEYFTAVLNAKGEIRAGSDGGPLPISKLVAEMKEDKEFAAAFEGTQKSGGGADPKAQQQQRQTGTGHQPTNDQRRNDGQDRAQRGVSKISAGLAARS
ncbi:hypothetical protein LESZY_01050 [Brevundimonas phage vB_BpoS-Leszy]|nr:hypothetical protein LESZY_01050 [Brevundimonas phage vB_BpoS-Leszy]